MTFLLKANICLYTQKAGVKVSAHYLQKSLFSLEKKVYHLILQPFNIRLWSGLGRNPYLGQTGRAGAGLGAEVTAGTGARPRPRIGQRAGGRSSRRRYPFLAGTDLIRSLRARRNRRLLTYLFLQLQGGSGWWSWDGGVGGGGGCGGGGGGRDDITKRYLLYLIQNNPESPCEIKSIKSTKINQALRISLEWSFNTSVWADLLLNLFLNK